MSFFKSLRKVAKIAVPLAAAYFAPGVGSAISGGLGLGLGTAGSAALGGAVLGGAGTALTGGGFKGALLNAGIGAAGGYLGNGGLGGAASSVPERGGNLLSSTLNSANSSALGAAPTTFLGRLSQGASSALGSLPTGSGALAAGSLLSNGLSAGLGVKANNSAANDLLKAQKEQLGVLQPFAEGSFNPGDLTADPGYQFLLKQGQDTVAATNAAHGGYYSGGALKDAADYTKNLADTTYNNAFQRWQSNRNANFAGAQQVAGVLGNTGETNAKTTINNSNAITRGLANVLGTQGFNASGDSFGTGNDEIMKYLLAQYGHGKAA